MRAAILAGGKGSRIAHFFPDLPKPMIPVCGKPLLQYQVENLISAGITEITLIIGYKAKVIKDYFNGGEKFGAKIDYITEKTPLGTGGALSLLPKEDTLVIFGDIFFDIELRRFINYHNKKKSQITLFAHPNSHPHDSDIIVTDSVGKVTDWKSKREKHGDLRNLVNAGMYVFSAESLPSGEAVKLDLEHDIIIPKIGGNIFAYRSTEYVKDMGTPERLEQVENDFKNGITAARNLKNKQKAIFLDRDGTLNVYAGFVTKSEQIKLVEGAAKAIKLINQSKYLAVCVTNQPVIARGDVSFEELEAIHARLDTLLGEGGAYLDDLLFCPHHTDKGFEGERPEYKIDCECRKPKAGLLLQAAKRYNIDLSKSYMLGDSNADIAAGKTAGCTAVGLKTGIALEDKKHNAQPDFICENILEAIKAILKD